VQYSPILLSEKSSVLDLGIRAAMALISGEPSRTLVVINER